MSEDTKITLSYF